RAGPREPTIIDPGQDALFGPTRSPPACTPQAEIVARLAQSAGFRLRRGHVGTEGIGRACDPRFRPTRLATHIEDCCRLRIPVAAFVFEISCAFTRFTQD